MLFAAGCSSLQTLTPGLTEPLPSWAVFLYAVLLFLYQASNLPLHQYCNLETGLFSLRALYSDISLECDTCSRAEA